jgi:hypothetical protein
VNKENNNLICYIKTNLKKDKSNVIYHVNIAQISRKVMLWDFLSLFNIFPHFARCEGSLEHILSAGVMVE